MKTKRWAMLAGGMMLVGLLLLVTRAAAEDVGETCVNVSDNVAVAACTRAIRSGGHNAHLLAVLTATVARPMASRAMLLQDRKR